MGFRTVVATRATSPPAKSTLDADEVLPLAG